VQVSSSTAAASIFGTVDQVVAQYCPNAASGSSSPSKSIVEEALEKVGSARAEACLLLMAAATGACKPDSRGEQQKTTPAPPRPSRRAQVLGAGALSGIRGGGNGAGAGGGLANLANLASNVGSGQLASSLGSGSFVSQIMEAIANTPAVKAMSGLLSGGNRRR
jgi:hypothetical protein